MELFDLVAKLTLDAKEYERAIADAENEGKNLQDVEATLDLDITPFEQAVAEAEGTDVADPESPDLGLDDTEFQGVVADAEGTEVDDPEEPDLDLDDTEFQSVVEEAEGTDVADPESPNLGLETTDYNSALDQAQADTESWSGIIGDIFTELKGFIVAAGITAVISGIVSSLTDAVDLARSLGDNIDKSSRAMSISTDAYQEWSHMLDINGASITDLNRGLMSMRKLLGGGEVSKDATEAFEKIGLSAKVASGEITNVEDAMMYALKTLADWDTSTDQGLAERDLLAQQLFGRGGTKLNALFDGTSKDMDDLINQAHELGLVMTKDEVANAAAYNDAVTNMNASLTALKTSLVSEILPVLTDIFNNAAKIFALFNWRTNEDSLSDTFKEIDEKGADALVTLNENKTEAIALIDKLAKMGDYWTLDDNGKKTFDQLAQELITLFPQLDTVINNNKNAIHENTEEIKGNIEEWTKLEQQRILSDNLAEKRMAIAKQYAEALDKETQADVKETEAAGKRATAIEQINDMLKENSVLSSVLQVKFGTSTLTEDNADEMLKYIKESGYDTKELGIEALDEWSKLTSEAKDLRAEAEKMTAEADAASESYTKYAEALAQKLGIAISDTQTATSEAQTLKSTLESLPHEVRINLNANMPVAMPKAKGDWNVPYDDYPALLHRGERVLTASQARQMDSGSGGGSVDMSQLSSVVEQAIKSGMSGATVNSYLSGRDVTDDVNRDTGRQLKARRFRG